MKWALLLMLAMPDAFVPLTFAYATEAACERARAVAISTDELIVVTARCEKMA